MDVEICYGISKDSTCSQSGGPMMRIPISTDDPAAIKTAAAPTSLPIPGEFVLLGAGEIDYSF